MPQSNRVARAVAVAALLGVTGCGQKGVKGGGTGGLAHGPAAPAQVHSATAAPSFSAPLQAPLPLGDAPGLSVAALAARSQNAWTRCYQGFTGSNDSKRDALRLATMCGPATGMHQVGPRFEGALAAEVASTVRVQLRKQCVRIVAAAEGSVEDLEVELLAPSEGESLALVNPGQPWAVLPKDKPVCVSKEGVYRVRLSSHTGVGQYDFRVLEYWP